MFNTKLLSGKKGYKLYTVYEVQLAILRNATSYYLSLRCLMIDLKYICKSRRLKVNLHVLASCFEGNISIATTIVCPLIIERVQITLFTTSPVSIISSTRILETTISIDIFTVVLSGFQCFI